MPTILTLSDQTISVYYYACYLTWENQDLFLATCYIYFIMRIILFEKNNNFVIIMSILFHCCYWKQSRYLWDSDLFNHKIALGLPNCCLTFIQSNLMYTLFIKTSLQFPVPELDNSLYVSEKYLVFYYIGIIMDSHANWDLRKFSSQEKNSNNI